MHARNGRELKNGDKLVQLAFDSGKVTSLGVLYDAVPGNDSCNGNIAPIHGNTGACLCDCLHVEDLAAILKEFGLDKRPTGVAGAAMGGVFDKLRKGEALKAAEEAILNACKGASVEPALLKQVVGLIPAHGWRLSDAAASLKLTPEQIQQIEEILKIVLPILLALLAGV